MRITHLGHSCLLVDVAGTRLLLDPGTLTPSFDGIGHVDAVLITHQHPDHLDVDRLPGLLTDADTELLAEPQTVTVLGKAGLSAGTLPAGAEHQVGAVRVRAVGGDHAVVHPEVPRVGNVGLLVDAPGEPLLFHPGDAYDAVPEAVDVLAVPLAAPWSKAAEMVDFARAVASSMAFPIHDAHLSPAGRGLYLGLLDRMSPERTTVRDLAGAGSVEV